MRKAKRLKALVAATLTAATLFTACGSPASSSAAASGSTASTAGSSSVADAAPAIDEIVFMSKDFYNDADYTELFKDLFKEDTGVELNTIAIPSNGWEDKVTASFMSGELPDLARLPADLYPFVKQEFLLPLDEYIEANPAVKQVLADNPGATEAFQFFGETYGISVSNAKYMTIWVRQDWLDQLGMEMPTNLDEFVEMLRAFRDSDLDGNGKNDTIPLTMPATLQPMDMFAAFFGTRNEVYMEDGKAVVPYRTEEYKEFMEFMKTLYDEGLIDKEIPTNTAYGTIREKFNTGVAGAAVMWDDSSSSFINGLAKSGIEGEIAYMPAFKNEDGDGAMGLSYFAADSPICLTTACENPQEVFDTFFDWYLTSENGIISTSVGLEGYSFEVVDGQVVADPEKGIGFHGQSFPPVDMDYEYPFQFDETYQFKYDCISEMANTGAEMSDLMNTKFVPSDNTDFANINGDLTAKMQELFHGYLVGNTDYEGYLAAFETYAAEIGLDEAVAG